MRKLFSIVFIIVVYTNSYAQQWAFGIQCASVVTNTHMIFDNKIESHPNLWDPLFSFSVNGYAQFNLNEKCGISAEPGFIRKGEILIGNENDPSDDVSIHRNYLHIPVLGHFKFAGHFYTSIGPEFAYLLNVLAKSDDLENDISRLYEKNFEISGIIGIGVTVFNHIDIEFRYNHGITTYREMVWTNINGEIQATAVEYNNYLQLLVRYKF